MAQPDYNLIDSFRQEHSVLATARQSLILEVNFVLEEIEMTKNIIREAKKLDYPDPLDRVWQMNSLYQTLDKLNARRVKLENAIRYVRTSIKYTNTNMNFVRKQLHEVNLVLDEIEITKNIIREAKKLEYPDPLDRVWQMNSLYRTLDKLNARRVKLENAISRLNAS